MTTRDKHITELVAIIKDYEETLSNKNKHIAELEEKLEAETEKMPRVDIVSLIHLLMI